jgi:hypothetical protein
MRTNKVICAVSLKHPTTPAILPSLHGTERSDVLMFCFWRWNLLSMFVMFCSRVFSFDQSWYIEIWPIMPVLPSHDSFCGATGK